MIQKPIDEIEKADIEALVANGVSEDRTTEFKLELPGRSDGDKKEFLADVSSFSNSTGGDLIYGLEERNGVANSTPGIATRDADADKLRLEQIIRSGVDPRMPGIQIHTIDGFPNGPVLIIRVPKSWASPHMVTHQNTSKFYARSTAGKYQLDVGSYELRLLCQTQCPSVFADFASIGYRR